MSMLHGKMTTPGNNDIFFAVSNNNGTSFGTSNKHEQQYWHVLSIPQIAASGNNVYVTWEDITPRQH